MGNEDGTENPFSFKEEAVWGNRSRIFQGTVHNANEWAPFWTLKLGSTLSDLKFPKFAGPGSASPLGCPESDRYLGRRKCHFHSCFLGLFTAT